MSRRNAACRSANRCQPHAVFGTENLLDPGCSASECLDVCNDFRQPGGDRFGPLQLAQVVVVAEAERGNPPLAFEFAELKRLKRKGPFPKISSCSIVGETKSAA
jgi:hypothetical protein